MKYISHSESETERIGGEFAKKLCAGSIVAMLGGMGLGKTAFVRGLARGLGTAERVTSPTYTIVNEYDTVPPLFHFDLYRLSGAEDLFGIGFDDYIARRGICVIEWFENAEGEYQPTHTVEISRGEDENSRVINITFASGVEE